MGKAAEKTRRVKDALERREGDRVPISDFFWTNFVRRCREELGAGDDFDPYKHWDLDYIVINPNMDPHITGVQILENTPDRKLVRTGFETLIERRQTQPLPNYLQHDTESWEAMEAFRFDDPLDPRRYHEKIDDQINCVGDELVLGLPPWAERVAERADDICVFGSICEPHEMLWRICGTENILYKMAEEPERLAVFLGRIGEFMEGIVEGQAQAAKGKLTGLYVWGDVAYKNGMFFSPVYWREVYKPLLKRLCDAAKRHGLKLIYHGCGNATEIYDDLIEAGIDAYNPLEAKAGLDVVDLKRRYGDRWSWCGNLNMQVLETNDPEKVRREVLRKLNAAKGGGYLPQSDHSVSSGVSAATYDLVVKLVREYGGYPLKLGEFDEKI